METSKTFAVCIDEIKQNFVFGELFSTCYTTSIAMSDGSVREIALRPMMRDGHLVVEFKDGDHVSYMGPNGTTTHGKLMVQLMSMDMLAGDSAKTAE